MASANRLMELRHFWFSSNRIAEIKVPAWPIPIHHTKLVMAKPHITGVRKPQIPGPSTNSRAVEIAKIPNSASPKPKPRNQKGGVRLVCTTLAIWSVMVLNVYPGAIISCGSGFSITTFCSSAMLVP